MCPFVRKDRLLAPPSFPLSVTPGLDGPDLGRRCWFWGRGTTWTWSWSWNDDGPATYSCKEHAGGLGVCSSGLHVFCAPGDRVVIDLLGTPGLSKPFPTGTFSRHRTTCGGLCSALDTVRKQPMGM